MSARRGRPDEARRVAEDLAHLLAAGPDGRPSAGDAAPPSEAELERLTRLVRWLRSAERVPVAPEAEQRLVRRVLERTTGEDLTWRGEWRLIGSFLRERLRVSGAWRVLAASVLVHLLALPVVAYLVWVAPERRPVVRFELPPREEGRTFADPDREEIVVDVPEPAPLDLGAARRTVAGDRAWNARRRDRFLLQQGDVPRLAAEALSSAGSADTAAEIGWLVARSRWLTEGRWEPRLDDTTRIDRVDLTALALQAEVLLDGLVLDHGSPALGEVLAELALRGADEGSRDAQRRALVELVLDRARSYGAWPAPPGFDPLASAPAPAPEVLERVARAMGEDRLRAHPVGSLWLSWAESHRD